MALHLSLLAPALLFSEVRPFGPIATENVAVDVVTPDQVPGNPPQPASAPRSQSSDTFDLSLKPALETSPSNSSVANSSASNPAASAPSEQAASPPASAPTAAAPPAATSPASQLQQQQAALTPSKPSPNGTPGPASAADRRQPAMQPQASAPVQPPPPAYVQPQPDLSVKYHVLLGLPQDAPGDAFDAPASENADIEANAIAAFRRHLKECATLPKSIAPTDDVAVKLRVALTRDGRLAAEPLLIEAKASMKGPLLMQAAIGSLQSCQPYGMLPADKYDQWKVLDISFTPRDFGAS